MLSALVVGAAHRLADRRWRQIGARAAGEARSFYVSRLRRRVGIFAVREMARHRIRRIPFIGMPRQVYERLPSARPAFHERGGWRTSAQDFYAFQVQSAPLSPLADA